jgi:hypothetical protein
MIAFADEGAELVAREAKAGKPREQTASFAPAPRPADAPSEARQAFENLFSREAPASEPAGVEEGAGEVYLSEEALGTEEFVEEGSEGPVGETPGEWEVPSGEEVGAAPPEGTVTDPAAPEDTTGEYQADQPVAEPATPAGPERTV